MPDKEGFSDAQIAMLAVVAGGIAGAATYATALSANAMASAVTGQPVVDPGKAATVVAVVTTALYADAASRTDTNPTSRGR